MDNSALLSVLVLGISFLGGCGSRSSDISSLDSVDNPLPPCPDSPNCIRITKLVAVPIDTAFNASLEAINSLGPKNVTVSKEKYRIETVFSVFFFDDDMVLQLVKKNPGSCYLHIRSASRVGESDLGVNTRRVKKFLNNLDF